MRTPRFICLTCLLALAAHADETELQTLRRENAALRQRVAELERQVAELRGETAALEQEKQELQELAGVTTDGTVLDQANAAITTNFDPASGTTTTATRAIPATVEQGSRADHYLSMVMAQSGERPTALPEAVTLFVQTRYSGGEYRGAGEATLMIDGEPVTVPVTDYKALRRQVRAGNTARTLADETLALRVPWPVIERLASARQSSMQLRGVRLAIDRDHRAAARALVIRATPRADE